jgi:hypothetical protein
MLNDADANNSSAQLVPAEWPATRNASAPKTTAALSHPADRVSRGFARRSGFALGGTDMPMSMSRRPARRHGPGAASERALGPISRQVPGRGIHGLLKRAK